MVDYPNSKKARKVFLCLFVGDGGGGGGAATRVPEGLQSDGDGDGAAESEDAKAKFEGRRQRESRRERNGKQKAVKGGRDWILRKKEVRGVRKIRLFSVLIESSSDRSCIEDEERKACPTTPSIPVAKEGQYSRERGSTHPFHGLLFYLYLTLLVAHAKTDRFFCCILLPRS